MAIDLTQRQEAQRRFLRTLLAWHDINQAELGTVIGCTQTAAGRKLNGKRKLTVDELLLIADHLGVQPGNLVDPPDLGDTLGPVREHAGGLVRSTFCHTRRSRPTRYRLVSRRRRSCGVDPRIRW